jgi:hypothetical protein
MRLIAEASHIYKLQGDDELEQGSQVSERVSPACV